MEITPSAFQELHVKDFSSELICIHVFCSVLLCLVFGQTALQGHKHIVFNSEIL